MKSIIAALLLTICLPLAPAHAYWACFSSDGKISPLDGYGLSRQADAEYEAMGHCRNNARRPERCRILCCAEDTWSFPKVPVKDRFKFCTEAGR